jgi:hypothetical protein
MNLENILSLFPLGDIAKRLLTEYEYPDAFGENLAPLCEISLEGETVVIIPKAEYGVQGVIPYKGGADIEFGAIEGDTQSLTTKLWTIGELVLPETYDGWKRRGLSPAEVDAKVAANARAKFNTKREAVVAAFLNTAANYGGNTHGPTDKWDTANGDPLTDIQTAVKALDFTPTGVCMSQAAYSSMVMNDNFKDYFKGFTIGTQSVVKDLLAAYLGITGLELFVDDGKGYIPRWATSVTAMPLYNKHVVVVHHSPGLKGAFLSNGDPVTAFAVTTYATGAVYPREGWVQLPMKGNAAGFVIQDYFKVQKVNEKAGYLITDVIS